MNQNIQGTGTSEDPFTHIFVAPYAPRCLRELATCAVEQAMTDGEPKIIRTPASILEYAQGVKNDYRVNGTGTFTEDNVLCFMWEKMGELEVDGFVKTLEDDQISMTIERIK